MFDPFYCRNFNNCLRLNKPLIIIWKYFLKNKNHMHPGYYRHWACALRLSKSSYLIIRVLFVYLYFLLRKSQEIIFKNTFRFFKTEFDIGLWFFSIRSFAPGALHMPVFHTLIITLFIRRNLEVKWSAAIFFSLHSGQVSSMLNTLSNTQLNKNCLTYSFRQLNFRMSTHFSGSTRAILSRI